MAKTTKKTGYKIRPDGKKNTGRPTKLTPETISKLENAFSLGCSDVEACLYADISKTALYNYQQAHPEFVDRKEKLKESLVLKSRTVIAEELNRKNPDIAKWYLERKRKDEFSTKTETGGFVNFVTTEPLNLNEIKQLREMFEK